MRFAFAFCLAVILLAPIASQAADRRDGGGPWIATAGIVRNGEQPGSGVYLNSGLIITAAHLTALDANMSVRIAGVVLRTKVLKQGSSEDVDLSLLLVDEQNCPRVLGYLGCNYVKRHLGQGIRSSLMPGALRRAHLIESACADSIR